MSILSAEDLVSLEKNILYIVGDVNAAMYDKVTYALAILESRGSPGVTLRIYSHGGSADIGFDIYDAIMFYPGHVTGVVMRLAHSMAAIFLQACDKRVILPHAEVLIHSIGDHRRTSLDILENERLLQNHIKGLKLSQERCINILTQRTRKKRTQIVRQLKKNEGLTAEEAFDFSLVDEVWSPEV